MVRARLLRCDPNHETHCYVTSTDVEMRTAPRAWRDSKRYLWIHGLQMPILPIIGFGIWHRSGHEVWWWLTPFLVFVVLPIVDRLNEPDPTNPPAFAVEDLTGDRYYRRLTYLYLPLQYAGLVLGCWAWVHGGMSVFGQVGAIVSVGTAGGVAINAAHELGHKRESLERALSVAGLAQTGYGHFYVEHNRGHHTRVATPEDPASARLGESFWAFWPRTVVGSVRSAWTLEARRLRLRDRRVVSWRNQNLAAWSVTVVLFGVLAAIFGPSVLIFLVAQAVFGFSLLEVVNYLEHYGLVRQMQPNGRYEKVQPRHSWNSDTRLTNVTLYQLQRHSDHHANPTRRYQALRSFDGAPQLPAGYATLIPLAWITPVWRRIMDDRVVAHYGGDVRLANVHPPAREKLLARYPMG
jgi:alkane 1-monooxygenase